MLYSTLSGRTYDVSQFDTEELKLFTWLQKKALHSPSHFHFDHETLDVVLKEGRLRKGRNAAIDWCIVDIQYDLSLNLRNEEK